MSAAAAALTATQTFNSITTTIIGNGGLNVIDVGSISSAPLTIKGGPSDLFVFNISGTYSDNVASTLSGVTADQILFNLPVSREMYFRLPGAPYLSARIWRLMAVPSSFRTLISSPVS